MLFFPTIAYVPIYWRGIHFPAGSTSSQKRILTHKLVLTQLPPNDILGARLCGRIFRYISHITCRHLCMCVFVLSTSTPTYASICECRREYRLLYFYDIYKYISFCMGVYSLYRYFQQILNCAIPNALSLLLKLPQLSYAANAAN